MITQDNEQEMIQFPMKFWELKEIFEKYDYDEKQLEKYFELESPKNPFSLIRDDNVKDIIHGIKGVIEIEMYCAKKGSTDIDILEDKAEIFLNREKDKTFVCIDYCYRDEFEGYRYCSEKDVLTRLIQCKICDEIEEEYDDYDGCGLRVGCCVKCAKKYPMDNITEGEYNEIINDYDLTKEEKESLKWLRNPSRFERAEDWERVVEVMKKLDDYKYLLKRCF